MLKKNLVKEKLKADQLVIGLGMQFAAPFIIELLGNIGFDFVFIDCEHKSGMSDQGVEEMIRVAESANLVPIVRVPENRPAIIGNYLDQGAMGIIAPHCKNKEVTESLVRSVKYPPVGERGIGGRQFSLSISNSTFSDYVKMANEETMTIALIEDSEAITNFSEIINVDGLDMIIIGQFDLSSSMGYPGEINHPVVREAIDGIINKARLAGKPVGIGPAPLQDMERMKELIKMGVRYIDIFMPGAFIGATQEIVDNLRNI